MAAPNREMVAPYLPETPSGYPIFADNPVNHNFTVVGYGESGTGNDGDYTDQVQRLTLTNVPVGGGEFTLTYTTPNGRRLDETSTIKTKQPDGMTLQRAIAFALGGRAGYPNVAVTPVGTDIRSSTFDLSGRSPDKTQGYCAQQLRPTASLMLR